MSNAEEKNIDIILKELHRVLDELTSDAKSKGKGVSEDLIDTKKERIEELKSALKASLEEEQSVSPTDTTFPPVPEITEEIPTEIHVSEPSTIGELKLEEEKPGLSEPATQPVELKIEPISPPIKIKEEKPVFETPTTTVPPATAVTTQDGCIIVNTILLYPKSTPEAEKIFLENMNTTLKRVSKKPVSIQLVWKIQYSDPSRELIMQFGTIVNQIKNTNATALFLLVNDSFNFEEFITKISPNILLAKTIKFSELKSKSFYLDIAIDILLLVK